MTATEATPSSSEGTSGGAAATEGPTSSAPPSGSNEESKPQQGKGSGAASDKEPSAEASRPHDAADDVTSVAQVPDEAIVASTGGDGGSSPLLWIGLGIAVLGTGSGLLVLRRRT